MNYLYISEVAKKCGVSSRRLQTLCSNGKIEGAICFGKAFMIPESIQKPIDGRTKASKDIMSIKHHIYIRYLNSM